MSAPWLGRFWRVVGLGALGLPARPLDTPEVATLRGLPVPA